MYLYDASRRESKMNPEQNLGKPLAQTLVFSVLGHLKACLAGVQAQHLFFESGSENVVFFVAFCIDQSSIDVKRFRA